MNTTPAQLRLAADILETGHPFAFGSGTTWNRAFDSTPFDCLKGGYQIRPVLATPPYPAQLHNPDNLTAEQVGVGYRLALRGERVEGAGEMWTGTAWLKDHGCEYVKEGTFRLSLKTPWPEPADPYAELKAAHAAGKVIQYRPESSEEWCDCRLPRWSEPLECYRIKPEPAEPQTKTVPLGPKDVPPGSVVQLFERADSTQLAAGFHSVACVCHSHIVVLNEYGYKVIVEWEPLEDWLINRSIPLTGKWNPDAWEPCSKQIPA